MTLFGNLFGKKSAAEHKEGPVWKTAAACRKGICAEAVKAASAGRSVVVVCLTNAAFDAVDVVLAPRQPGHCRDEFGRDALLQPFVASSLQLLEQLGMKEDEALSHAFITRAIENCQSP